MNLPEPQSVTFPALFDQIRNGTIKIPQFQRDFVWTKAQSARLLDSVIKGYPIGTFILWSTQERLRAIRNLGGIELPETPSGKVVKYVLDGQQRLTSLFVTLNGLTIKREEHEDDYSRMWLDLEKEEDEPLVLLEVKDRGDFSVIRLSDLLHGDFEFLASFPKPAQARIRLYKNRIESYQFSAVQINDAPIDIATEIFTRLNVGGKPLTPFEIMVAKSYDPVRGFDLAESYNALIGELAEIEYETISESNLLQAVSILAKRDARRKIILGLSKDAVLEHWPLMEGGLRHAIDYFWNAYGIPASRFNICTESAVTVLNPDSICANQIKHLSPSWTIVLSTAFVNPQKILRRLSRLSACPAVYTTHFSPTLRFRPESAVVPNDPHVDLPFARPRIACIAGSKNPPLNGHCTCIADRPKRLAFRISRPGNSAAGWLQRSWRRHGRGFEDSAPATRPLQCTSTRVDPTHRCLVNLT